MPGRPYERLMHGSEERGGRVVQPAALGLAAPQRGLVYDVAACAEVILKIGTN